MLSTGVDSGVDEVDSSRHGAGVALTFHASRLEDFAWRAWIFYVTMIRWVGNRKSQQLKRQ